MPPTSVWTSLAPLISIGSSSPSSSERAAITPSEIQRDRGEDDDPDQAGPPAQLRLAQPASAL